MFKQHLSTRTKTIQRATAYRSNNHSLKVKQFEMESKDVPVKGTQNYQLK